jgi:hypothetical protein
VPGGVNPVIEGDGADIDADAIAQADIPIHSDVSSMNAQLGWGFNGAPDLVSIMFAYNLAVFLKIRINRQNSSPLETRLGGDISFSLCMGVKHFWGAA